ncbi:MAG: transposase [Anaerolineae bacterium]
MADFEAAICRTCPLRERCPVKAGKRNPGHHLRFTQAEAQRAERRRRSQREQEEGRNLRAAVESTVRSVKHPFPAGKLPVRGRFRVACMLIGSAAVANLRRIHHYLEGKRRAEEREKRGLGKGKEARQGLGGFIFSRAQTALAVLSRSFQPTRPAVSW